MFIFAIICLDFTAVAAIIIIIIIRSHDPNLFQFVIGSNSA